MGVTVRHCGPARARAGHWCAFALLLGCAPLSPLPTGSDGGGTFDAGAAPPPANLTCLQVLRCVAACADADLPCPDACVARASPEGMTRATALAECIDAEQCTDAACLETRCQVPLDGCVGASTPPSTGTPLQTSAPPGSVPADLVGTWTGSRYGDTQTLALASNGTGSWSVATTWTQYACFSFKQLTKVGNIVVQPTAMTLYATQVVSSDQTCVPPATDTALPPVTEVIQWYRHETDPNVIFLIDAPCAAQYPGQENCQTLGCPISMYCTTRATRQ